MGTVMSRKRKEELERQIAALHEAIDELRRTLLHFKKSTATFVQLVEDGEAVYPALEQIQGPILRRDLTDAVEMFEATRQRARTAILTLGREQGASMSEVGRLLGISRQLASRLVAEADGRDDV